MSSSPSSDVFVINDVDTSGFKVAVAARYKDVANRVKAAVHFAAVEHVGATAVDGLLTKGDLDIQVRVPRERFAETVMTLAAVPGLRMSAGAYLPPDGQSFELADGHKIPVGVHVTVKDSAADEQWIFREILRRDDEVRASYQALKRACHGRPMQAYRDEKEALFDRLKESPRFACERLLEHFHWRFTVPVQWGDLDANAHVNNVVFYRWFESARAAMLFDVGFFHNTPHSGVGPILHSAGVRFRLPLVFPDVVTAAVGVTEVHEDRFTLGFALFSAQHRALAATGEGVIVSFDYGAKKKAPLPASLLTRLT